MSSPVSLQEAQALLSPLTRYPSAALAVSGGPDSLALMLLAATLREAGLVQSEITVLSVDHGLRLESRDEAAMVGKVAARLGLPHATLAWRPSAPPISGVQDAARNARYALMAEYCHMHGIPALVTAHQLEDQAETILMRLARGSGLDGLAAIPAMSRWIGLTMLRPLLSVPKARLMATLREAGIDWVEDPSNRDTRHERARIRIAQDAMRALGLTPEALARSARRLARAREALEHVSGEFLARHAEVSDAGYCMLDMNALLAAPEDIALRGIGSAIETIGGRPGPIRLSKLEALLASLKDRPGTSHTLAGCRVQRVENALGIFREARRSELPVIELAPGEHALWDNRFHVALARKATGPVKVQALGAGLTKVRRADFPWLDSLPRQARVALPACWRDGELISIAPVFPQGAHADASGFSAKWIGRNMA